MDVGTEPETQSSGSEDTLPIYRLGTRTADGSVKVGIYSGKQVSNLLELLFRHDLGQTSETVWRVTTLIERNYDPERTSATRAAQDCWEKATFFLNDEAHQALQQLTEDWWATSMRQLARGAAQGVNDRWVVITIH